MNTNKSDDCQSDRKENETHLMVENNNQQFQKILFDLNERVYDLEQKTKQDSKQLEELKIEIKKFEEKNLNIELNSFNSLYCSNFVFFHWIDDDEYFSFFPLDR